MAVLKTQRKEGELAVLTQARIMCEHTVRVCKNEKTFPKRNRWILTQPIVNEALDVMTHIRKANAVNVKTQEDYSYRRMEQIKAYGCCEALLTLMDIAYVVLQIDSKKMDHWVGLVVNTEKLLKRWRRGDMSRYKAFSSKEGHKRDFY